MRTFFSLVVVLALTVVSNAAGQDIKKGDRATVPNWQWVDVVNQEPVVQNFSNARRVIAYGEKCGIEYGGTAVAVATQGNDVLIRYTSPGQPMGTPCPTGVAFFLPKAEFSAMTAKYEEIRKKDAERRALVAKLLGK